jgi:hypothetical protein
MLPSESSPGLEVTVEDDINLIASRCTSCLATKVALEITALLCTRWKRWNSAVQLYKTESLAKPAQNNRNL